MKKLIFSILCILTAANCFADGRSDEIISRMSSKIASLGDYRVEFTAMADGNTNQGNYIVSGDRYFMSADGVEIICDGKTKYEINHDLEEVMIDAVDPNDTSILSNPTRTFDFRSSGMQGTYVGEAALSGKKCYQISIRMLDDDGTFERITLYVDNSSYLPVELRYKVRNSSGEVVLKVRNIESFKADNSLFRFNKAGYGGYEVVDFR